MKLVTAAEYRPPDGLRRIRRLVEAGATDTEVWREVAEYRPDRLTDMERATWVDRIQDWRKRGPGRPRGSSLSLAELEATVDRLRRKDIRRNTVHKPSQGRLAAEVPVARSTLSAWLAGHPGAWTHLRARWRA